MTWASAFLTDLLHSASEPELYPLLASQTQKSTQSAYGTRMYIQAMKPLQCLGLHSRASADRHVHWWQISNIQRCDRMLE